MSDISFLNEIAKHSSLQRSLTFNKPYSFKGIDFTPVKIDRLIEFDTCIEVLKIKQEHTRDKTLMKLPYLWFLAYASENYEKYDKPEYGMFIPLLFGLLELTTNQTDIKIMTERKTNGEYAKCILLINEVEFSSNDFKEIRKIILEQNGVEYDDQFIHESTLEAINQGKIHDMKQSGYISPTVDDLVNKFCIYMKKSKEEVVRDFTIRDFNKFLVEISAFEEYKLLKGGEVSGMVKFKNPIPHWYTGHEKYDWSGIIKVQCQNTQKGYRIF